MKLAINKNDYFYCINSTIIPRRVVYNDFKNYKIYKTLSFLCFVVNTIFFLNLCLQTRTW